MGGRNVNGLPLPPKVRVRYVPIRPTPFNDHLLGVQLRLAGKTKLRKDSYVNLETIYSLPFSMLELYDRKRAVTDFRLDSASIRWLRQQAGIEFSPLPGVRIERATSSSKSPSSYGPVQPLAKQLPSSYSTSQPVSQYAAASISRSTPATKTPLLPQYTTRAPPGRSQTAITARIVQLPHGVRYRTITDLQRSPQLTHNPTRCVVYVVGILIIILVAGLIVFGTARWVSSGSAVHVQAKSAHDGTVKPLSLRILWGWMAQAV
jgi:hypothetical protein